MLGKKNIMLILLTAMACLLGSCALRRESAASQPFSGENVIQMLGIRTWTAQGIP